MKPRRRLSTILLSLYSTDVYRDVAANWKGIENGVMRADPTGECEPQPRKVL